MTLDSKFPLSALPCASAEEPAPPSLDKRAIQERNVLSVLRYCHRFGWLTSRMLSALVWPNAAQALSMSRRTLKMMTEEKLLIARAMTRGGTAYLLAAKGARLLQEREGVAAQSGNALAIGNPVHRAASNWYLIHAIQAGFEVVTEHEIATERGPLRAFQGKVPDGLLIAEDGQCVLMECENAAKGRQERAKIAQLAQTCLGGSHQVELAPGLFLARLAIVATNVDALRWMAATFRDALRQGALTEMQAAEVDVCLLPVTESLVASERTAGNLWWDVILPSLD